jgi:hypothetical protein
VVVVDPTEAAGLMEAAEEVSTAAVVEVSIVAVAGSVIVAAEHIAEAAPTAARGLSEREVRTVAEALAEDRRRVATERAAAHTADSMHRAARARETAGFNPAAIPPRSEIVRRIFVPESIVPQ